MKKHFFYLRSLTFWFSLFSLQPSAQNTSPYWSLAGNSNASNTASKLGTTTAINLRLFTNNQERVHINYSNGYVGIGTTTPAYRLQVVNTGTSIYGQSSGGYGVYGNSSRAGYAGVYGYGTSTGVKGIGKDYGAYDSSNNGGIGVYGVTDMNNINSDHTTGVYGKGYYGLVGMGNLTGILGGGADYGVYGYSTYYDGIYGQGSYNGVEGSGVYNGVFGTSTNGYGIYGGSYNNYAGYFSGPVYSSGGFVASDKKLKQNITDVANAMDIINKLQPKYYEYRQDGNFKLMNLPQGKQYGLIAQDVEVILPNLIRETEFDTRMAKTPEPLDPSGKPNITKHDLGTASEKISFKALNYTELIPIMVKAMQELSKKNEELSKKTEEIDILKKEVEELKSMIVKYGLMSNSYDLNTMSLEQNTPNPFNTSTIIRYHLPESASSAKVVITDLSGKMIKSITLTSRGPGQLTFNSSTLNAGNYNYTLWVGGKQVDSKKMVIIK
jgi:hypothetical protein